MNAPSRPRARISIVRGAAMVAAFVLVAVGCKSTGEIQPPFIKEHKAPRSGLGGTIVFTSQQARRPAIFGIDPGASPNSRKSYGVASGAADSRAPVYSPDGRRLAYAATEGREGGVVIADVGSTDVKVVVKAPGIFDHPSWSPDGSQLAYAYNTGGSGSWEIDAIDLASSSIRRLVTGATTQNWGPAWSPDGTRVAFTSNRDGDSAIWLLDLNTGSQRKLVDSLGGNDEQPAWSPDGNRIVFTSDREMRRWQLFFVDPSTGTETRLIRSDTVDRYPSFSPNGDYIVFSTGYLAVYRADGRRFADGADRWKLTGRLALGATWSSLAHAVPAGARS